MGSRRRRPRGSTGRRGPYDGGGRQLDEEEALLVATGQESRMFPQTHVSHGTQAKITLTSEELVFCCTETSFYEAPRVAPPHPAGNCWQLLAAGHPGSRGLTAAEPSRATLRAWVHGARTSIQPTPLSRLCVMSYEGFERRSYFIAGRNSHVAGGRARQGARTRCRGPRWSWAGAVATGERVARWGLCRRRARSSVGNLLLLLLWCPPRPAPLPLRPSRRATEATPSPLPLCRAAPFWTAVRRPGQSG